MFKGLAQGLQQDKQIAKILAGKSLPVGMIIQPKWIPETQETIRTIEAVINSNFVPAPHTIHKKKLVEYRDENNRLVTQPTVLIDKAYDLIKTNLAKKLALHLVGLYTTDALNYMICNERYMTTSNIISFCVEIVQQAKCIRSKIDCHEVVRRAITALHYLID